MIIYCIKNTHLKYNFVSCANIIDRYEWSFDDYSDSLTLQKGYEVIKLEDGEFHIFDDDGDVYAYPECLFSDKPIDVKQDTWQDYEIKNRDRNAYEANELNEKIEYNRTHKPSLVDKILDFLG